MNDAEKEAIKVYREIEERCVTCSDESCRKAGVEIITLALKKKQDEIERLKVELNQYQTQTVNVVAFHKLEDEVQRLNEYLKQLIRDRQKVIYALDLSGSCDLSESVMLKINALTKKLSEKDSEIERLANIKGVQSEPCFCAGCESTIPKLNQDIKSLTARNKELEKSEKAFLETINKQGDEIKELKEDIKVQEDEIEQYIKQWRDAEDCNIKLIKKIAESREVIESLRKALSGRTVSCEACNGMAEKVKELKGEVVRWQNEFGVTGKKVRLLESKLAVAREALKVFAERNPENDPYQPLAKKALAELGEKP